MSPARQLSRLSNHAACGSAQWRRLCRKTQLRRHESCLFDLFRRSNPTGVASYLIAVNSQATRFLLVAWNFKLVFVPLQCASSCYSDLGAAEWFSLRAYARRHWSGLLTLMDDIVASMHRQRLDAKPDSDSRPNQHHRATTEPDHCLANAGNFRIGPVVPAKLFTFRAGHRAGPAVLASTR